MPFIAFKHLHVSIVALSVLLFVLRFIWRSMDASVAKQKWVKIVPHIIDTLLLLTIVGMLVHWQQWPWETPWLLNKLVGLVGYIVFGLIAMKAQRAWLRYGAFVVAMGWIAMLLHVAYSKQALLG
ncbi:invasion protein [Pseudidiomarina sediminum]|uniref:Invasion protein n=1 Tax=Pseudidiomarina sediminum TaxID=431675 RepID=A0A432Z8L7_9GAMM|nr:SirB2 family protein [Pseudidiomarina sediminum]MBY6063397.1 SirB2 family protein [Pseudidiomarina sediminum]RUO74237.1 invasion protein [Pseudidiomarina sediminum]